MERKGHVLSGIYYIILYTVPALIGVMFADRRRTIGNLEIILGDREEGTMFEGL